MKTRNSLIPHTFDKFKTFLIFATILIITITGFIIGMMGNISFGTLMLLVLGVASLFYILRRPYRGLILTVALVPLVQILPDVPILSSFFVLIGGLTLALLLMQNLILRKRMHLTAKPLYILGGLLAIIMLFGQLNLRFTVDRNYFLTYFQLVVLIFLCEQLLTTKKEIDELMLVYILSVLITALVAFLDYQSNLGSLLPYEYRPRGLVGNSNGLGMHLSVAMIMSYYFLRSHSHRIIQVLFAGIYVFFGIVLFISGSRGALLFFIPVALYQFFYGRGGRRLNGVILILIVVIMVLNFLPLDYWDRMAQIPSALRDASDTIGLRLQLWSVARQMWLTNPVFGIGPGMYYIYTGQDASLLGRPNGLATHNMYVTFLTENGIIGLTIFLGIVFVSIALFFKSYALAKQLNPPWVELVVAWQSALFVLLLNGTKANNGYHKIQWLCFGLAIVLWRLVQEQVTHQELLYPEEKDGYLPRYNRPKWYLGVKRQLK